MGSFDDIKRIEVSEFHTSNTEATYLAKYGEKYYEINAAVAGILSAAREAATEREAVERYIEACGGRYSEADVRSVLDKCMTLFDDTPAKKRRSFFVSI